MRYGCVRSTINRSVKLSPSEGIQTFWAANNQETFHRVTRTVTIIRRGITRDLIIVRIIARTIGTAGIVIIAIIILIITGASLIGITTPGWLEAISSQPNFFNGDSLRRSDRTRLGYLFS